MLLRQ